MRMNQDTRVKTLLKKHDYSAEIFCYPEFVFFKMPNKRYDDMSRLMRMPLEHGISLLVSNDNTITLRTYALKPIVQSSIDVTLLKESYDPRLCFYYDDKGIEIAGIDAFPIDNDEDKNKEKELFEAYEYIKMILKYPEYQDIDNIEREQAKEDFQQFYSTCRVKKSINTIKKIISYIYPLEELLT